MQALEIRAAQVARDLGKRGGPQSRLFGSEVVVDQSAHGVPVLVALLTALSRWVLTERDLGQDLLRRCSRRLDPEHAGLAQGDLASAAMLLPLDNPRLHCAVAVTATTKPKAEAVGVPEDFFVLARGQTSVGCGPGGDLELHGFSPFALQAEIREAEGNFCWQPARENRLETLRKARGLSLPGPKCHAR